MPTILYSAVSAPTSFGTFVFTVPHVIGGMALLWASWRRKCWFRNMSGPLGLIIQALVGGIFFLVPGYFMTKNWFDTFGCRSALQAGNVSTLTGELTITKTFHKPGYGYIEFGIGGQSFSTQTAGPGCDCGYIQSVGRNVLRAKNKQVRAQVMNGTVLGLELVQ